MLVQNIHSYINECNVLVNINIVVTVKRMFSVLVFLDSNMRDYTRIILIFVNE